MIDLNSLLENKQETTSIEFKSEFDGSAAAWLEIIKDLVGLVNSGGGYLLFGFDCQGQPSKKDISVLLETDPADLVNKINKYTSINFSNFKVHECNYDGNQVCVYEIGSCEYPIIFTSSGTYEKEKGKQVAAFQIGVVYFRHGAKTEPADNQDIRQFLEKKLIIIRNDWLSGIRQVVEAPNNSEIVVLPKAEKVVNYSNLEHIKLTNDVNATPYYALPIDDTHPYRQKELMKLINDKFGAKTINSYDLLCIRRVWNTDKDINLSYIQKFSSPRYGGVRNFV